MKRTYPGFYQWRQDKRQQSEQKQEQRIPARIWPTEYAIEKQPERSERSEYGSVTISW